MPITPQEKTRRVTYQLPETLAAWIEEHAKTLNDSSPEYVVTQVMQQYRKQEERTAASKPKKVSRRAA